MNSEFVYIAMHHCHDFNKPTLKEPMKQGVTMATVNKRKSAYFIRLEQDISMRQKWTTPQSEKRVGVGGNCWSSPGEN